MRNTIVRTFTTKYADSVIYSDGQIATATLPVPSTVSTVDQAEKYIRKTLTTGKLIEVREVSVSTSLFGMSEDDFMKLASPVGERSKETRNTISKTVQTNVGTLVFMNADRKIGTMTVTVPDAQLKRLDKYAQKVAPENCKGITIEDIKSINQLYVMTEKDFFAHAKPMIDYNHFA